jgi:hypothetical protein
VGLLNSKLAVKLFELIILPLISGAIKRLAKRLWKDWKEYRGKDEKKDKKEEGLPEQK